MKAWMSSNLGKGLRALVRVFGLPRSQKLKVSLQHYLWIVLVNK